MAMIDTSILNTIKMKLGGIAITNTDFDNDLILSINAVLPTLYQLGLSDQPYTIDDSTMVWSDILLDGEAFTMDPLITYVALKVKLLFDPPTSSVLMENINAQIRELEWRGFITHNYVGEIEGLYNSGTSSTNTQTGE